MTGPRPTTDLEITSAILHCTLIWLNALIILSTNKQTSKSAEAGTLN